MIEMTGLGDIDATFSYVPSTCILRARRGEKLQIRLAEIQWLRPDGVRRLNSALRRTRSRKAEQK